MGSETFLMKPRAALVLADMQNKNLADSVFAAGLAPIVRNSLESALHKLRHDQFELIVIDRDHVQVDVLEFALNVRDFDETTPLVVVGRPQNDDEDRALTRNKVAVVVSEPPGSPGFVKKLARIARPGGSATRA